MNITSIKGMWQHWPVVPRVRVGCLLLALLLGNGALLRGGKADTVWLKSQEAPLHGRIVAEDADFVDLETGPGAGRWTRISGNDIRWMHRCIDSAGLESLDPSDPAGYLRCAGELAAVEFDPSARRLASELAVIALHCELYPPEMQWGRRRAVDSPRARAALRLLLELEPEEKKRRRILEFGHWSGLMPPVNGTKEGDRLQPPTPDARPAEVSEDDRTQLLETVRAVRRGTAPRGIPGTGSGEFDQLLAPWQGWMTARELEAAIRSQDPLPPGLLLKLVRLERILESQGGMEAAVFADPNWSVPARFPAATVPELPNTRSLTGHDPVFCHWRDGKWESGRTP